MGQKFWRVGVAAGVLTDYVDGDGEFWTPLNTATNNVICAASSATSIGVRGTIDDPAY